MVGLTSIYDLLFLDFFLLLFLQHAVLSLSSQGTWPLCTTIKAEFCANFFCSSLNPIEPKFAIFGPSKYCVSYFSFSGNNCCLVMSIDKNLGHRVGKSRTSLLPDMPRPLPLASNLMMKMMFIMMRMISIEYEDVSVDEAWIWWWCWPSPVRPAIKTDIGESRHNGRSVKVLNLGWLSSHDIKRGRKTFIKLWSR